jgi:hypothetical protein
VTPQANPKDSPASGQTLRILEPLDPPISDQVFLSLTDAAPANGARNRERLSVQSVRIGLLVTFVIGVVSLGQPRTADAEIIRVAMLPVSINSSLPETDHISAGLADMVSARLEQNGQIMVIRLDAPAASREDAIAAARKAGAEYVLFGSYTQFGDGASLDLHCAPIVGGEAAAPRRVFIHAGSTGEIIPKLGVLLESVTRYLVGDAASSGPRAGADAAAPDAPGATSLADIEQRVEALERVIFAPPAAAKPVAE